METSDSEVVEFVVYYLKDMVYQLYKEWYQSRGDDEEFSL